MVDLISKFMRDYNRFTGDGLPGEPVGAPLPIGSAKSGPYVATKAEFREWGLLLEASALSAGLVVFDSVAELTAATAIAVTQKALVAGQEFHIVAAATYTAGPTVIDLSGIAGQAVSTSRDVDCTFAEDTRPIGFFQSVYGSSETIPVTYAGASFDLDLTQAAAFDVTTAGGVELKAVRDQTSSKYPAASYSVAPATAVPTPANNAVAFQAWINSHDLYQTVELPAWNIPLGGIGIDLGNRKMDGQGPATVLNFSSVGASTDLLTVGGDTGVANRAGQISHFTLDANGQGQDAIRFTGGIGCGAEHVQVLAAGRDMFHVEQTSASRFFERFYLNQCSGNEGAGRYGLCLRLAPFGSGATPQYINKTHIRDSKFFGPTVAGLGILIEDSGGGGTAVKIGGGLTLQGFHYQYAGTDAAHKGAMHVVRASGASGYIDEISMRECTLESQGTGAGAPVSNTAMLVEDSGSGNWLLSFRDSGNLLTGWGQWWAYNDPSAKPTGIRLYDIKTAVYGDFRNYPAKIFGTSSGVPSSVSAPAGGAVAIFNGATGNGSRWMVTAGAIGNTSTATAVVASGTSAPVVVASLASTGNLSIGVSGANVTVANAGGAAASVYWSVIPLL